MWNPDKIEIVNLFSHKKSEYEFKNNQCTVIFGKNETDNGLDNNGSGKSTIFEGICIALTNGSLRDINKEDFINYDEESCKITFHLHNDFLKMKLKIVRQFFRGTKPVMVEIWENDKLNKQTTSVNEANKRIIELIGINREDLLKYFIIAQDSRYTFFTANDVDKKEIMNRITSADMINPVIEDLDLRAKEKKLEIGAVEDEVSRLTDKKDLILEQYEESLSNDTTADEITELNLQIKKNTETKNGLSKSIQVTENTKIIRLNEIESERKKIQDKKKLKADINSKKEEIDECRTTIRKLKAEIEAKITCPHCQKDFINDSEFDITPVEAEELKKQTEKLAMEIIEEKEKLQDKLDQIELQEEAISDMEIEISSLNSKIRSMNADSKYLDSDTDKCEKKITILNQKKDNNKQLKSLKDKLTEIEKELEDKAKIVVALNIELEQITFWQFYMGKKGFMTYLANKSIKIIEGITNSYLKKFGVDLSVLINGFTILKNGTVREKIDIFVQNDGITSKSFVSKSGGERGRINIAGILGIQHLINLSTNGKGLNLICLDEVFPGIDAKGQENIIKIIEKIGITIVMITQNITDGFNIENTLKVRKVEGISTYY